MTIHSTVKALDAALAHIQTEWMARTDADDYNLPQRFRQLVEFIRSSPGLDVVGSGVLEFEQDHAPVAVRQVSSRHQDILRFIKRRSVLTT